MSDRSYFQLRLLATDKPAEVLAYLDGEGLDFDDVPSVSNLLGNWEAEEMTVGYYDECASVLIKLDPNIVFYCWSDPAYEWLGGLVMYTPELGRFDADCDSTGNAVFRAEQIMGFVGGNGNSIEDLAAFTGTAWTDAFKLLR